MFRLAAHERKGILASVMLVIVLPPVTTTASRTCAVAGHEAPSVSVPASVR